MPLLPARDVATAGFEAAGPRFLPVGRALVSAVLVDLLGVGLQFVTPAPARRKRTGPRRPAPYGRGA